MISSPEGDQWVSSSIVSETALRGDSLLVLGRGGNGFVSPFAVRLKPSDSPVRIVRAGFRSVLEDRIDNPEARGLTGGLLMGLRGMIAPETAEAFKSSGTSHLLALSGLHTAAAAAMMTLISGLFFGRRPVSALTAAAGIAVFVVLSGARPSTVRAGIMSVCALLWMTRRGGRPDLLSFWFLALAASVSAIPETLFDRGAWMSYGAVLSLIFLCKTFRGFWGFVLSPLFAGITVTAALAPLITDMYGGFAWLGPTATVVSLPFMIGVMILGAAAAAGVPMTERALTEVSTLWHGILGRLAHEPVSLPWILMWPLWLAALVLLRVVSRWNGFHRRFR